jgi:hypothetical protein
MPKGMYDEGKVRTVNVSDNLIPVIFWKNDI